MPAYLVRIIGTRDLVGIFTADDGLGLAIAVDECTDVSDCEYAELPYGGIMWESPAKPVPLNAGDTDDVKSRAEAFPWLGASLSERWWNVVYGFEQVKWTPFDPDGPDNLDPAAKARPSGPAQVLPLRKRRS
jgi:hypothetical protein